MRMMPRSAALLGLLAILASCSPGFGTAAVTMPPVSADATASASPSAPAVTEAPTPTASDAGPVDGTFVVDGHALYVECRGQGSPTFLFQNGSGGSHHQWDPVYDALAKETRACRYDLPNTGDSEHIPTVRTVDDDIDDLLALEQQGVLAPPYVVVAYSAGSFPAWRLATREPDRVAGLVFVDPLLPGYEAAYQELLPDADRPARREERAGANDQRYDYAASERLLGGPDQLARLPIRLVVNDRHIRWQGCGDWCESLTGTTHELIDDLLARWPDASVTRVKGTHAVITEHPDEVLRAAQEVLAAARDR